MTFGLFDITQFMGRDGKSETSDGSVALTAWPCNGLAMALHWLHLCDQFFTCLFTVDLRMQKCKSCMA